MKKIALSVILLLTLSLGACGEVVNMANKYCNINGGDKIRETYNDINKGFDAVEHDVNALDTKTDAIDSRVDTIITTPAEDVSAQEIIDARKGKPSLGAKIGEIDSHLADNALNIKSYGAVGDGVHDDAPAFAAAVAALPGGGRIIVPWTPNEYLVADSITLTSNICLQGVGGQPKIKLANDTNQNVIQAYSQENIIVDNLLIDANGTNQDEGLYPSEHLNGLRFDGITNLIVRNVTVENGLLENFYLKDCIGMQFENCHGNGSRLDGWNIHACKNGTFINVSASNVVSSMTGNGNGIELEDGCENLKFMGVNTKNNTVTAGINIQHHPDEPTCKNIIITNFTSENDKMGIQIQNDSDGTILKDFHIIGAVDGIELIGCNAVTIENGYMEVSNRGVFTNTSVSNTKMKNLSIIAYGGSTMYRHLDFRVAMTNVSIDGLYAGAGPTDYSILFSQACTGVSLNNINISGAKGIRFSANMTDFLLTNSLIQTSSLYGIEIRAVTIENMIVDNTQIKSQSTGVRVFASVVGNNIKFRNCTIVAQEGGGVLHEGDNTFDAIFESCKITTISNAASNHAVTHAAGGKGSRYVNCILESGSAIGVDIKSGASNIKFQGGSIKSTSNGIEIGTSNKGLGDMNDITIMGVVFDTLNFCICAESTANVSTPNQIKRLKVGDCIFKNAVKSLAWRGAEDFDFVTLTGNVSINISTAYTDPGSGTNIVKAGNNPAF